MDDSKAGYQATPSATLEQQMMDACAPKNEREWWAFAEIGRLRAEVEALRADAALKRDLLLWALYHAQGGSSRVGQAIRRHLGIEQHARLTPEQIKDAERAAQGGEHG